MLGWYLELISRHFLINSERKTILQVESTDIYHIFISTEFDREVPDYVTMNRTKVLLKQILPLGTHLEIPVDAYLERHFQAISKFILISIKMQSPTLTSTDLAQSRQN